MEQELMRWRAHKEAETAIIKALLRSYPDNAFLLAASDLEEIGRDVWDFIQQEVKRRGLDHQESQR